MLDRTIGHVVVSQMEAQLICGQEKATVGLRGVTAEAIVASLSLMSDANASKQYHPQERVYDRSSQSAMDEFSNGSTSGDLGNKHACNYM